MSIFDSWQNRKDNAKAIAEWMKQNPDPADWFTLYIWSEDRDPEQEKILEDKLAEHNIPHRVKIETVLNSPAAIDGIIGGEIDAANFDKTFADYKVVDGIPYFKNIPVPVYNAIVDEQISSLSSSYVEEAGDEDQNDIMDEINKTHE